MMLWRIATGTVSEAYMEFMRFEKREDDVESRTAKCGIHAGFADIGMANGPDVQMPYLSP